MVVFEFSDYKELIKGFIRANKSIRGYQKKMADAAGCQPSLLSQVLNGTLHLTADQAVGLALFWNLTDDETEYFLCLVHYARAATANYRKILAARLKALKQKYQDISTMRQSHGDGVSIENQARYYSSWHFQAIHMAATIPGLNTIDKIADHLSLPQALVKEVAGKLVAMGLLAEQSGQIKPLQNNLHLGKTSPFINQSHLIWRQFAAMRVQQQQPDDYHYTAIYAISRDDFQKVQNLLADVIKKMDGIVAPSKEERVYALMMDSFALS